MSMALPARLLLKMTIRDQLSLIEKVPSSVSPIEPVSMI
jgi:hypothetical protein